MMLKFGQFWSKFVFKYALGVLLFAICVSFLAFRAMSSLTISTQIEALMPQGTQSVQTLNEALRKTGSFASIQIVGTAKSPEDAMEFIQAVKTEIDQFDWVESSQFKEDVSVLEQHKLLLLSEPELLELERDINIAYPTLLAKQLSDMLGSEVTFIFRDENLTGNSNTVLDDERLEQIQGEIGGNAETSRLFTSPDALTLVLVVWPKPGLESLGDAKRMVVESQTLIDTLKTKSIYTTIETGVAGRIANKVAQFDAIVNDLKWGLLTSITLIALLLVWSYRSLMVLPIILLPLVLGILWTLGATAVTIGGLNLITAFLTLILFGLGIDFGIHNFSRYREERRAGHTSRDALETVITETGGASLIAALTTALAFFSLTLTEFRAFTEFGLIAGIGILLTFSSMYSVLPALIVVSEKLGWRADKIKASKAPRVKKSAFINALSYPKRVWVLILLALVFTGTFVSQIAFERNIKNLEARQPETLIAATQAVKRVFSDGHDRAIIVVETLEELTALNDYFKTFIMADTDTPTIQKVSSLLDFVPEQDAQRRRLKIISRLKTRADQLQGFAPEKYDASKRYLSIADLNAADLPPALRRTYLGTESEPGYLMYVYNSVSMDDSETAQLFYNDAARIDIGETSYFSASEGFIFVEMIALMKADAIKAISLVTLSTAILVLLFVRTLTGAIVVLAPVLLGVLITIAIMGAFGPNLSIMNMVILPSLIGIAVDNSIHIYHRYTHDLPTSDIPKIMNSTGRAAALTTLTTLIGFGGMVTASMGGLRSMGLLAIIGFISCLLMTWLLLPLLLSLHKTRYLRQENRYGSR